MEQFHVFLVEDEESVRETYGQLLKGAGHKVSNASNYEQAIAMLDDDIDLVLVDVVLNGKSGLDVLKAIRERHPELPVIMVSAFADKENVLESLHLGAVDYLEKPIRPEMLLKTVESWVGLRLDHSLKDWHTVFQQLRASELNIQRAYDRLNFVLVSTAAVIYAASASEGCPINFISGNVEKMCGFEAGSFTGDSHFLLSRVHPDDQEYVKSELKRVFDRGENHFEYRFQHKDGHYIWISDHVRLEKNREGESEVLGFWVDATNRRRAEEQVRQMAYFDPLTGLPNRSLFYDRLRQAIAQASRNRSSMAVMFMDLDFFKPINDELGHEYGDQALVEVGKRLQHCVREADTVARIGGDEFSIILGEISSESAACMVADKIIASIMEPMMLKEHQYSLGISIGIYISAPDHDDAEAIMRMADDAMYQAKSSGRNRYCLYQATGHELPEELNRSLQLERSLRQALERGEFQVYYQPKVHLKDGRITGMHALLRWESPDAGLVMPDTFVPLAVKTGLIVPIGEWVLRQACQQNAAWQAEGLPVVPVSVNIASEQLRRRDFVPMVQRVLDETGLASDMLQLEISESDLMQFGATGIEALNELNELGIKITVDNFGTGFFSLQALRSMPIHELKMNRSLVQLISQGEDKKSIANAIIAMGHILQHQVVAEGVETKDQLDFLREHDSDGMLGYLSSPPVPVEQVAEQLRNQRLDID